MTKNIFHTASVRLTSIYLCSIMAISLIFSIGIYQVSSQEVARGIRRQNAPLGQIVGFGGPEMMQEFLQEQEDSITAARARIKGNLIFINIFIFMSGGVLSYYFARRTLQPIEQVHAAQSRFTADASHELRTPITAMRIENEVTLTDPNLTLKDAKKQLESNIEELDKLTALSEGLLQLARLQEDPHNDQEALLKDIIKEATERVRALAEKKSQRLHANQIPKLRVKGDQVRLTEAFVTLLDNAVKYSPEKSKISIQAKQKTKFVEVKVIDEGMGIETKHLPHIFKRFYRADDSRTGSGQNGYGIGLAIAKETIEASGGAIDVTSTKDKGTTFTIHLPKLT